MRCQAASDSQNWCDYVVREGRLGPSPSNTISLLPASMEKHWSKKDTTLTSPRKYHLNLKYSVGLDYFWVFFKQIIFHFSEFQMYRSRLTVFLCLTPLSSASPWCLGIRYLSFIINYNLITESDICCDSLSNLWLMRHRTIRVEKEALMCKSFTAESDAFILKYTMLEKHFWCIQIWFQKTGLFGKTSCFPIAPTL